MIAKTPVLRVIDPRRLDGVRELIDLEVVQRHLGLNVDYRSACVDIVESLEMRLYFCCGPHGMWLAWLDSPTREVAYADENPMLEQPDGSLVSMGKWRRPWLLHSDSCLQASDCHCWSFSQRDALLGACALALDESALIFYETAELGRFVPSTALRQLRAVEQMRTLSEFVLVDRSLRAWEACHQQAGMLRSAIQAGQQFTDGLIRVKDKLESQLGEDIRPHVEALLSGRAQIADIPAGLTDDQISAIDHLLQLIGPHRDALRATAAITSALAEAGKIL